MLVAATNPGREALLQELWKHFSQGKKPDLVRQLTSDMPSEAQGSYMLHAAKCMSFQERIGVIESLLRTFSAFEMSSFVDFLPYIWDDLAVQFTTKMLSCMPAADRTRVAAQLSRDEELAAQKAKAAFDGSDDAVLAVAGASTDRVSIDPSQLLPDELPGWEALGASSSSNTNYDLATTLRVVGDCIELAVSEIVADRLAMAASGASMARRGAALSTCAPWPRLVFNVLLRSVPELVALQVQASDGQAEPSGQPAASKLPPRLITLLDAREALWTLLTSLRSHSKAHTRARLYARLCGALKHEFSERRVELVMRILTSLPPADLQAVRVVFTDPTGAASGWLPMQGTFEDSPTLLTAVRALEPELGGAQRTAALIEKLSAKAEPDPRTEITWSTPSAPQVIDADKALMAIVDAFDHARAKHLHALAQLHEQLEVRRAAGSLDSVEFIDRMRAFDGNLSESSAAAIYLDCDLAASEAHARERHRREGESPAAAATASDAVPRAIFLRVCDEHGVTQTG